MESFDIIALEDHQDDIDFVAQLEARLLEQARLNGIPPDDYVEILLGRLLPDLPDESPPQNAPRRTGSARGKARMADDFDESLEDFKDYMQ